MSRNSPYRQPDLAWIEPGFAIGSSPYSEQREAISEAGIRVVVTVHDADEQAAAAWAELGVEVISIPTRDWIAIPSATFERVVEIITDCLAQDRPVLLHCLAGVNRAPTLAAAVLCRRHGLTPEAAIEAVRQARPVASPTPEQAASLRAWLERGI
jgi:predicted protein tyrosine phosphatase